MTTILDYVNQLEAGGIGSGRHKTFWHGTDLKSARKIMRHGLRSVARGKGDMIHLSRHEFVARSYAENRAVLRFGEKAAVIAVKVPEEEISKTERHPDDLESKHFKNGKKFLQQKWGEFGIVNADKHIPASYIDRSKSYIVDTSTGEKTPL